MEIVTGTTVQNSHSQPELYIKVGVPYRQNIRIYSKDPDLCGLPEYEGAVLADLVGYTPEVDFRVAPSSASALLLEFLHESDPSYNPATKGVAKVPSVKVGSIGAAQGALTVQLENQLTVDLYKGDRLPPVSSTYRSVVLSEDAFEGDYVLQVEPLLDDVPGGFEWSLGILQLEASAAVTQSLSGQTAGHTDLKLTDPQGFEYFGNMPRPKFAVKIIEEGITV
jgi:hypothetical protein